MYIAPGQGQKTPQGLKVSINIPRVMIYINYDEPASRLSTKSSKKYRSLYRNFF